ncbi:hypothetical protein ACLB2K_005727 [Fragaria x ananassa]
MDARRDDLPGMRGEVASMGARRDDPPRVIFVIGISPTAESRPLFFCPRDSGHWIWDKLPDSYHRHLVDLSGAQPKIAMDTRYERSTLKLPSGNTCSMRYLWNQSGSSDLQAAGPGGRKKIAMDTWSSVMLNGSFAGDDLFNPQPDHLLIPVAPASNIRVRKSVALQTREAVSGIAKSKVHAPDSSSFSSDRSRAIPTYRPVWRQKGQGALVGSPGGLIKTLVIWVEFNRYDPGVDLARDKNSSGGILEEEGIYPALVGGPLATHRGIAPERHSTERQTLHPRDMSLRSRVTPSGMGNPY